jgi:hypothetical protein
MVLLYQKKLVKQLVAHQVYLSSILQHGNILYFIINLENYSTKTNSNRIYLFPCYSSSVTHANKSKRKTLAVNDILNAIDDMEFESFIQPLNDALKGFKFVFLIIFYFIS